MSSFLKLTAHVSQDGEWFVAHSPELPEGNGQGLTEEAALESLRQSIVLLMEDRRQDAQQGLQGGERLVPLVLG